MIKVTDEKVAVGHIFMNSFECSVHIGWQEDIFGCIIEFIDHSTDEVISDSIHEILIFDLNIFDLLIKLQTFLNEHILIN